MRILPLILFVLTLTGCGSSAPATNAALATEVEVLKEGLEAWKTGGSPASFTDPDWKSGAKLIEYHVMKAGAEEEGETVCTVLLKLELRGKPVERTVNYRVTPAPKKSITRVLAK